MMKSLLWWGAVVFTLGAFVFAWFVIPGVGGSSPSTASPQDSLTHDLIEFAVFVSSVALAAGSALVGVGMGRWKHPRRSPRDGSSEV